MGIMSFVKGAGERILTNARAAVQMHPGHEEHGASSTVASATPASSGPASATDPAGEPIINYIRAQNLEVDDLQVRFDAPTSTVVVSGTARDQETREKVVLCCGNIEGVEK